MRNNTAKLEMAFSEFNKAVENASKEYRVKLIERMYRDIVQRSPVLTGSYVCSHRIGVGQVDSSVTVKKPFNRSVIKKVLDWALRRPTQVNSHAYMEAQRKQALKQLAKLAKPNAYSPVYITNNIPHALNVEYIGWKKTQPYHVYGLTYHEYMLKEKGIMKEVEMELSTRIRWL